MRCSQVTSSIGQSFWNLRVAALSRVTVALQLERLDPVDVDRESAAENGDDDGETDRGLGRRDRRSHKRPGSMPWMGASEECTTSGKREKVRKVRLTALSISSIDIRMIDRVAAHDHADGAHGEERGCQHPR